MPKPIVLDSLPSVQLLEDVTRESSKRIIEHLSAYRGQKVALDIFSDGGDALGAFAVSSYISNPANDMHVEARVYGNAYSAALIIAMGAEKAYIVSSAFALAHYAYVPGVEASDLSKEDQDMLASLNDSQVELFAKRSGKTPNAVRKLMEKNTPITAEEAIAFGFFDGIIATASRMAALKRINQPAMAEPTKVKVIGKLLNAIALGGSQVEVEVEASAEQAALKDIADQATKDRQDAEAKATEDAAALQALKDREADALAKLEEATAATKLAEKATEEVTAKLTTATTEASAKDAVIVALKADLAKLKKLPTAKAIALSAEGTAVEPGESDTPATVGGPTENEARLRRIADEMKKKATK